MSAEVTEQTSADGTPQYSAECSYCGVRCGVFPNPGGPRTWASAHDKNYHPSVVIARLTEERKARERAEALRAGPPLPRQPEVDLYPRTRPVRASAVCAGDVVVVTYGAPQRIVAANTRDGLIALSARHLASDNRTPSLPLGLFHPDAVINKAVMR